MSSTPLHTALHTLHATLLATIPESHHDDPAVHKILTERVPVFVERALRTLETKRDNASHIEQTVTALFRDHCAGNYVYNAANNGFYEVNKYGMQLRMRTSDSILMSLLPYVPAELHVHRRQVLRGVRAKMCAQSVLDWTPSKRCIERMTTEVRRNFTTYEEARYFMTLLGAIALRREDVLLRATDAYDAPIHLWHGARVDDVVTCVQRILHDTTRTFSPFWSKVKRRMHRSYPLARLWVLHFPRLADKRAPFRALERAPLAFVASCCHHFRHAAQEGSASQQHHHHQENPLGLVGWVNNDVVRYTRELQTSRALYERYVHERVAMLAEDDATDNTDGTPTTTTPPSLAPRRYLLFRELHADLCEYLIAHNLPTDVLTKHDLLTHTDALLTHEPFGTRGTKRVYHGTFHDAAVNDTVHELFLHFVNTMLVELLTSDTPSTPTTAAVLYATAPHTPVTTTQLHNNYKMWCRHYATVQGDAGSEPTPVATGSSGVPDDASTAADHHTKHWYCSYTLFAFFLRQKLAPTPVAATAEGTPKPPRKAATWQVRVVPHRDTWKHYIAQYERDQPTHTMVEWLAREFGVTHVPQHSGNANATNCAQLDDSDMTAILDELQQFSSSPPLSSVAPVAGSTSMHALVLDGANDHADDSSSDNDDINA